MAPRACAASARARRSSVLVSRPLAPGVCTTTAKTSCASRAGSSGPSATATSMPSAAARVVTTATVCGRVSASSSRVRPVFTDRRARVIASATAVASSSRLAPEVGSAVRSETMVWKFSSASSRPWLISGW